jgi:hypothetical protein
MLVSLSSSSLSILPSSSSRGPVYWLGGLNGEGRGSNGAGRSGSKGLRGSKSVSLEIGALLFSLFLFHRAYFRMFQLRASHRGYSYYLE